jgi:hypothetical protein
VKESDPAALRRLDWRFLLPRPELGSAFVDDPLDAGLVAALHGAGVHVIAPTGPDASGASPAGSPGVDVAVLVAPVPERIPRALAEVRPGGSVYLELASPLDRLRRGPSGRRSMGPGAAVRELEAAGAVGIVARWVWPSHRDALELVPLGDRAAIELSLGRRRGRLGRFAAGVLRLVATASWLARVLPAVNVVAHRPDPAEGSQAASLTSDTAAAAVSDPDITGPGVAGVRSVVLTPRHRASRHVVFLVLDAGGRLRWVAKAPRDAGDDAALVREAGVLERLAADPMAAGAAPGLVAPPDRSGWPLLIETAVAGATLDRRRVHADPDGWAARAADLVEVLARSGARPASEAEDRFDRLIRGPLEGLRADAVQDGDPLGLVGLVERTLAGLGDLPWAELPVVLEHGDLAPPNLIATDAGALAAIDWELAEPAGLPGHDLVLFLGFAAVARVSPGGAADVEAGAALVESAFAGPDAWATSRLRGHLDRLGIDPRWAAALTIAPYARMTASMPARTGRRAGRWLARDRHLAIWRRFVERLP